MNEILEIEMVVGYKVCGELKEIKTDAYGSVEPGILSNLKNFILKSICEKESGDSLYWHSGPLSRAINDLGVTDIEFRVVGKIEEMKL